MRRFLQSACVFASILFRGRHGNESDWLMDRGIFGGIPIVGGTDDLDDLHKRYIHKDVWDGLDFIESGSLLDELDVLGDDGGVGEEISTNVALLVIFGRGRRSRSWIILVCNLVLL